MRAIKPRCLAGCPTSQASRLAVSVSRSKTLNVRVFAHHPNEMTRVHSQRHRSTYHCECPPELEELYHPIEDALEDTKANPERLVILAGIFEYARPDIETLERQRDPENVHEIWQIASLREFAAVKDWMDGGIPAHERTSSSPTTLTSLARGRATSRRSFRTSTFIGSSTSWGPRPTRL
jgi:hypothetical protein